jgi:ArsR family transcriptional regulator
LADINRLRILNLLLHGELCGCDIQYVMGASQPNVSRHLTYLKNCGLVADRRVGFRVFYSLAEDHSRVLKPLFNFLRTAFSNEQVLKHDTQKLKKAVESGACTVSQWRPYSAVGSKSWPAGA